MVGGKKVLTSGRCGRMAGWRSEELTDMWQEKRKEEKETEDVALKREEVHARFGWVGLMID